MKKFAALATLIVLPFALATAADEPAKSKPDPAQTFKKFDRDADGAISLEEYKAGMVGHIAPSRIDEVFKKKDADGDGKLSLPELMYIPPREAATPAPADAAAKK
jgi:hypothetical protein